MPHWNHVLFFFFFAVEDSQPSIVSGLKAESSTEYILVIVIMSVVGLAVVLLVAVTISVSRHSETLAMYPMYSPSFICKAS